MKKFVKISIISFTALTLTVIISLSLWLGISFAKYSSLALDESLISKPTLAIELYDKSNRPLKDENSFNKPFVKASAIPEHVKQSFIAIEDQNFYKHNGLNYKRIVKASINNLLSHSLKEGASTISQQLIKNTHLTSEKTFDRKIKEIVLTKKLEKSHTKNEILESYLNAIYYGNNCYGIEEAANYYFSLPTAKLDVAQSALLAGIIKSPSKYDPILHKQSAIERRNLVLSEMNKCGYITEEEKYLFSRSPLNLNINDVHSYPLNSYGEYALNEACAILNMPAKDIAMNGYKIHTYLDLDCQNSLKYALEKEDFEGNDYCGIVIDARSHAVSAIAGESAYKILEVKRQPGSCIKPILVYAPAINEDLITPETQILDEPLCLGGYNPKNVNGKYSGYISASTALAKSVNIPAIKILSYVGIEKAKAYASDMGIEFDESDNSYAIALGGMTYGVDIKSLADSYTVFCNSGRYDKSSFVEYITDKEGKILFRHKPCERQVLREDCAFLMTTMLSEAVSNGTAKALSGLDFPVIAKTGTTSKNKENLDAWCIACTPRQVCAVWCGNLDNTPITIAGGNEPTRTIKNYYLNFTPQTEGEFTRPSTVVERDVDLTCLEEEHLLKLPAPSCPERFKKKCYFSVFNEPKEISNNFHSIGDTTFLISANKDDVEIKFEARKNLKYKIYDDKKLVKQIENVSGSVEIHEKFDSDIVKIISYFDELNQKEDLFKLDKPTPQKKKKWLI